MRSCMAQTPTQVEERANAHGWAVIKRRIMDYPTCANVNCLAQVEHEGDYCCDRCRSYMSMNKGEFRGYTKNTIGDRSVRQAKRRAWGQSRKNKNKRTANKYKRSQLRGSGSGARPKMRRQLGAGGKRVSRSR